MAKNPPWSEVDKVWLLRQWGELPDEQVAQKVGRSIKACKVMYSKLTSTKSIPRKRWTKNEETRLLYYWGNENASDTAERMGRSVQSCRMKVQELQGSSAVISKHYTLGEVCDITGFSPYQVKGFLRKLRTQIKVRKHGQIWIITNDQLEVIKEYAGDMTRKWARDWDACQECGSTDMVGSGAHQGHGRCYRCYHRIWKQQKRSELTRQVIGPSVENMPDT